ncbi:MAG: aminotransferase class V-fold PLP-dependent enzyme [Clostridia bacterium]|nr:aminotransferase class V-fold PLP-dependent enzyme [Clostridia bacterium]
MIYFDNAATSFPKPESVGRAMISAMEKAGGNPGRGAHPLSLAASAAVYECREELASFIGLDKPENVVFTYNTTYALNIAIRAFAKPRTAVLCSCLEHNSVVRPLRAMGCEILTFDALADEESLLFEIADKLKRVSLVICTHASNVLPVRLPVARISRLCRNRGIPMIVDTAQSAGVLDIDMKNIQADAVCFAGHKGLYGPMGCGAVAFAERYTSGTKKLTPLISGGSGVNSLDPDMPDVLPERFEGGTLGVPAIAGLCAGIRAVREVGTDAIRAHEYNLCARTAEILGNTRRVHLYTPPHPSGSLLLFNVTGMSPDRAASTLADHQICVRAGLHCSPSAHERIGTAPTGAVRVSFGAFNTLPEIEKFAAAIKELIKNG